MLVLLIALGHGWSYLALGLGFLKGPDGKIPINTRPDWKVHIGRFGRFSPHTRLAGPEGHPD